MQPPRAWKPAPRDCRSPGRGSGRPGQPAGRIFSHAQGAAQRPEIMHLPKGVLKILSLYKGIPGATHAIAA